MPATFATMGQAAARLRASAIDEGAMVFVIALFLCGIDPPSLAPQGAPNLLHWRYTL